MTDLFYRNRANRWAVAYLAALVVALLVFWQVGFVSYNPLKFDVTHIVGPDGLPTTVLKTGAVIGVHRSICSTENIGVQFFPPFVMKPVSSSPSRRACMTSKKAALSRRMGLSCRIFHRVNTSISARCNSSPRSLGGVRW